jgi:hypothetical protein
MPELVKIVFSDETAIAFVQKSVKGRRQVSRCNTKGRAGKDRISLWRELCVIMVRKEVALEADLTRIKAALDKNELPSFADVQSLCRGELLSFAASPSPCSLRANISSLRCSCRGEYFRPERRHHRPCCKSAASRSCCHPTAEAAVSTHNANERRRRPDPRTALLRSQSLASSNCEGSRATARTAQEISTLTAFSLALFDMARNRNQSCTRSSLLRNGNGGARRDGSILRWC